MLAYPVRIWKCRTPSEAGQALAAITVVEQVVRWLQQMARDA